MHTIDVLTTVDTPRLHFLTNITSLTTNLAQVPPCLTRLAVRGSPFGAFDREEQAAELDESEDAADGEDYAPVLAVAEEETEDLGDDYA